MDALGADLLAGADRVAVELARDVVVGPDDDLAAGHPVELLVDPLALAHHAPQEREPAHEPFRRHDHDVEHAVVDGRVALVDQGVEVRVGVEGRVGAVRRERRAGTYTALQHVSAWRGRTRGNTLVFFEGTGDWLGQTVDVEIIGATTWYVLARPVALASALV